MASRSAKKRRVAEERLEKARMETRARRRETDRGASERRARFETDASPDQRVIWPGELEVEPAHPFEDVSFTDPVHDRWD